VQEGLEGEARVSDWIEPYAGFEFIGSGVHVSRSYQVEKLELLGLDPDVYGDHVDPSFYIGMGIRAGIDAGISAEGNVNMLGSVQMHCPVELEESLIPRGRIEAVDPVPRGHQITTDVWFERIDGKRAVSVPRRSLKPDPSKEKQGAGERPPPVITDVSLLTPLSEHRLIPDAVRSYSSEGNSIHYEMQAANRAGFRAPIIGGGMGVHFLVAELWSEQSEELSLDIYFRRPVFWDDEFYVGRTDFAIALIRDGKVLTEARING